MMIVFVLIKNNKYNLLEKQNTMPPKKDSKKQAVARPDNSGIPKSDIQFKFTLNIKTDANELPFAVMFQWFGITSDKIQRIDTPLIDTWQKGTDGRLGFQKICDAIRVDYDFCKNLCTKRFYVYFVNGEDNKVQDMIYLDYSSLIMFKGENVQPTFTFKSQTVKVMGIDQFQIKLTANKELVQQTYRHYLNPFEVEVIGVKDAPVDNSLKYQPSYIRYSFFDGTTAQTNQVVGQQTLIWNHKHVFLAGLIEPALLKQKLRYGYMKFQFHDRDQLQNRKIKEDTPLFDLSKAIEQQMASEKPVQQDPKKKGAKKQPQKKQAKKDVKKDAKKKDIKLGQPILPAKNQYFQNNYGVSAFYLIDFLKPSMRTARYKAPVVPRTTFQDLQSKNIDLNTTARNQMQKIISSNNYFEKDTNIVVSFTLSYAVGTFVKPVAQEPAVVQDLKKAKKDVKQAAPVVPVQQKLQKQVATPLDVFQRVVYVIPYKSPDLVTKIDNTFYQANIKAFSLKNRREATTYLLKQQQKSNIKLDYLTGIQLIDNQSRIYIIQGLREGAMKKLHEFMIKNAQNTKSFKIFKNSNITFLKRLYTNFNLDIKRLRFRPSLTQLLLDPIIYIKSKVPQEISLNLNKINQIKKVCDDLRAVDSMNLWPDAQVIVQIERKFSDSLSYQDIHGVQEEKKRKIEGTMNSTSKQAKPINFMTNADLKYVTMDDFTLPKIGANPITDMAQSMPNVGSGTSKKFVQTKTFMKDDAKMIKTYDMRLRKAQVPPNQPVYIYAGQKNNWYEKQMREMREKINQDKNHIYTYSKDYLGLTIGPRNQQQQRKKQMQFSGTKNISPNKFSNVLIRTKQQRMKLPKGLTKQQIDHIRNNPYHIDKSLQKQMKKGTRDLPVHQQNKPQFQKYIKKPQYFSTPQVNQFQKITPAQRFKMDQQRKKKQQQQNRKKLIGDPVVKVKKGYCSDVAYGVDRFQDIRQGQAVKKGIIDIHKKNKEKRPIQNYQVSFQLKQDKIDPSFNHLVRKDNPKENTGPLQFNNYQRPQILTMTSLTKPLRKPDF